MLCVRQEDAMKPSAADPSRGQPRAPRRRRSRTLGRTLTMQIVGAGLLALIGSLLLLGLLIQQSAGEAAQRTVEQRAAVVAENISGLFGDWHDELLTAHQNAVL